MGRPKSAPEPTPVNSKLDEAIKTILKKYDSGSIMWLNAKPVEDIRAISTGCIALDNAIGVGGIPRGRITEIWGPEGCGKTSIALHTVAECQKAGGLAAYVDTENALDVVYAEKLGVDPSKMLISQPGCAEEALDIVKYLVESNFILLFGVEL